MDAFAQPAAVAPPSLETPSHLHHLHHLHHVPTPQLAEQSGAERHKSHDGLHGLNARSCVTCRRRKVKCDKQNPCSNCTKAGSTCVIPAPGRAPRKARQGARIVSEREAELLKRLRRLEGVVEELSGQADVEATKQHSPASDDSPSKETDTAETSHGKEHAVRVVGMDEGNGGRKAWILKAFRVGNGPPKTEFNMDELQAGVGRLVVDEGKSHYIASPFWAQIADEVSEIKDLLNDQECESDSDIPLWPTHTVTDSNHQSFIMGYNSSDVGLRSLHPLPSQIPFYWQIFLENVHPLVMILHRPTMNAVIKEVRNNLNNLSRSTEALMFSIYFATITSLDAEEVRKNMGVEKDVLLKQYRFGVEQALARAGFLNTEEIVTVQALVLFLVCVRRHDDSRFVWSMTGLALRIAQSLGLHRDGTKFGLTPFDTEMRRRLWWQVCALDTRAAEDHGSDPSITDYSYDTKFPLSINDEDLDPTAAEPPIERSGATEMTFCLIRYEICNLKRKLTYVPPGPGPCTSHVGDVSTLEQKEKLVRECQEHLEAKYLRYCEGAGALCWVAATFARLMLAKFPLVIYHHLTPPGRPNSLDQATKDRLLIASTKLIEHSRELQFEASTTRWGWLFHTYTQWHALAYILGELCIRANSAITERAWRIIDVEFSKFSVHGGQQSMLWKPVRKLLAKAIRKRQENLGMGGNDVEDGGQGVPREYVAQPSGADANARCPGMVAARRQMAEGGLRTTGLVTLMDPATASQNTFTSNVSMTPPQMVAMNAGAPHQLPLQMQQPDHGNQQQPWPMDGNGFLDIDMGAVDGEINWDGWEDLVRSFQVNADSHQPQDIARVPTFRGFGGTGQWG